MKPSVDGMDPLPVCGQALSKMGHLKRTKHMTNKIAKMIVIAGVALAAVPALSACNTIEGAGKDVQAGGEAVSDAAKEAKN